MKKRISGLIFSLMLLPFCLHAATFPLDVTVKNGSMAGVAEADNVVSFKGVPFAAPPVGDLRFKGPVDPSAWTGVLRADHYSKSCPQFAKYEDRYTSGKGPYSSEFFELGEVSEDCLYLNVWTPAKEPSEKLPVMVFFYGGGFFMGSASTPAYNAHGLASKGAVVVTLNYRLGILGFLASAELDKESAHHVSGNYGTLDQVQALKWVKENIRAFGGDPTNVTIFGQSAGGGSVHFLSISPLARGLFAKAIVQSATMYPQDPLLNRGAMSYKTLNEAEEAYAAYLRKAGVTSLQQLRSMSLKEIMSLPSAPFPPAFFCPLVDGYVLPQSFRETYAKHLQADVPFLIGGNSEDLGGVPEMTTTVPEYVQWAEKKFGTLKDEFLRLYPATTDAEAGIQENQAIHDQNLISKVLWAQEFEAGNHQPLFLYYWTHPLPGLHTERFGAFHTSDVPYVMGSLATMSRPYTQDDWKVAAMMARYWVNFATKGDPNGPGLPKWPEYRKSGLAMRLDSKSEPIFAGGSRAKIHFFKEYFATFPAK